jgi:hypothetical protein
MAAPSLSVNDNGTWKTVNQPHVKDGDVWKNIHNVWIRDANTWKLAHKTAVGQYSAGTTTRWEGAAFQGQSPYAAYYTVPDDGTRYLRVIVVGQSGGGGGGARTHGGYYGKHQTCSYETHAAYSYIGGAGGAARHYEFTLEVESGNRFQAAFWNVVPGYGLGNLGGDSKDLYLATASATAAGTQVCGDTGGAAIGENWFKSYLSYNLSIVAGGGAGGIGACVKVQSICDVGGFSNAWGYDIPGTGTGPGAQGATGSIAVTDQLSRIVTTHTNGAHASYHWEDYGPGNGGITSTGGDGRAGYISITEYK